MDWFFSWIRRLANYDAPARQDYQYLIGRSFSPPLVQLAQLGGGPNDGGLTAIANLVLRKAISRIPYSVWCGLWPDSSYNAHVERTEHGAVILLSTGFLQAVVDFCHLLMHQVVLDRPDSQPPKQLPQCEVAKYLERIAKATRPPTIACTPPAGALPGTLYSELSRISGPRAQMLNNIIVSTIGFAIAHEAAHIRLGHLERAPLRFGPEKPDQKDKHGLSEDRRKLGNLMFSWAEEIDADAEALRIMLRVPHQYWEEPYLGVIVFTELTDAVLKSEGVPRYPHPLLRRSAAIGTVHPKSLGAEFPVCEPFVQTIELLRYGPWPQPDQEALRILYAWGEVFDPKEIPMGDNIQGVRVLSSKIHDFIAADFVRARACVAHLGIASRGVSRVVSGSHLIIFATCYDSFRRVYSTREEWVEADRLLRSVITDLDWTLDLWRRSVVWNSQMQ